MVKELKSRSENCRTCKFLFIGSSAKVGRCDRFPVAVIRNDGELMRGCGEYAKGDPLVSENNAPKTEMVDIDGVTKPVAKSIQRAKK